MKKTELTNQQKLDWFKAQLQFKETLMKVTEQEIAFMQTNISDLQEIIDRENNQPTDAEIASGEFKMH